MEPRMILNPNKELVDKVLKRIRLNDGRCPCQPISEDIDTRCPCSDFFEHHKCHCSLFIQAED